MAETIRYVDTDVSGGAGTGVDWANAYHDLYAWEDAEEANLANPMHVYVSAHAGTADTTSTNITGWTLTAANYILIEAADEAGHHDKAVAAGWDATRYRLEVTDADCIASTEDFVRVKGLQLHQVYSSVAAKSCFSIWNTGASSTLHIYNCRIVGDTNASANNIGIYVGDAELTVYIYNCIIYNCDSQGISASEQLNTYVYNCTVFGCAGSGINRVVSGTVTVKNCAVFNNGDDFVGTIATIDYCASDDGDGTNVQDFTAEATDWDKVWIDYAGGDLGLKDYTTPPCCIGKGTDLSGLGIFTDDIAGTARGAVWDIGAFEYVGGAPPPTVPDVPIPINYRTLRKR